MANGNTSHSPVRCRTWCFTLNNYTEEELSQLSQTIVSAQDFAYQCEKGENGTPHIQGCVKWKNQRRFETLKNLYPRYHWEKCRNWKASYEYCQKEEGRIDGPWTKQKARMGDIAGKLFLWQAILQKLFELRPDDRSICCLVDETGDSGKTKFCKHICMNNPKALYLSGSAKYMKYAIMKCIDEGVVPTVLLLDIPRCDKNLDYRGIEEIKNGIFFNVHYEAKMVTYPCPHVIIFTNNRPDFSKLSLDRWVLYKPDKPLPLPSGEEGVATHRARARLGVIRKINF